MVTGEGPEVAGHAQSSEGRFAAKLRLEQRVMRNSPVPRRREGLGGCERGEAVTWKGLARSPAAMPFIRRRRGLVGPGT